MYGVTRYYDPDDEFGVRYDDPALGIAWPVAAERIVLSERDAGLPLLADAGERPSWPG
jgi:dTDP-4-dehydrorhamnose 3,5-epimerase